MKTVNFDEENQRILRKKERKSSIYKTIHRKIKVKKGIPKKSNTKRQNQYQELANLVGVLA